MIIVGKKEGFITGDNHIYDLVKDIPDRIIFTGYVDNNLLKQYYKQADLFIFPSLYEGFGLPPLEALAVGTNVICSDIPVLREILKNKVKITLFMSFIKNFFSYSKLISSFIHDIIESWR